MGKRELTMISLAQGYTSKFFEPLMFSNDMIPPIFPYFSPFGCRYLRILSEKFESEKWKAADPMYLQFPCTE